MQKGLGQILTVIFVITAAILLTGTYYAYTSVPMGDYLPIKETPNPQPSTSSIQIKKAGEIIEPFNRFKIEGNKVFNTNNEEVPVVRFTNPLFNTSFLYPAELYLSSRLYKKDDYQALILSMVNNPESESEPGEPGYGIVKDNINSLLDCRIDPDPGGICSEGIPYWLDISIGNERNPIYSEHLVENINDRRVYSISSQNIDGKYHTSYRIQVDSGGGVYELGLSTTADFEKKKDYAFALWLLVNTFKANP